MKRLIKYDGVTWIKPVYGKYGVEWIPLKTDGNINKDDLIESIRTINLHDDQMHVNLPIRCRITLKIKAKWNKIMQQILNRLPLTLIEKLCRKNKI